MQAGDMVREESLFCHANLPGSHDWHALLPAPSFPSGLYFPLDLTLDRPRLAPAASAPSAALERPFGSRCS